MERPFIMDSGPFWMARLKVERAKVLIRDVAAELDRYRANPPFENRVVIELDGSISAETKIVCGPVMAGAIIGDVVHNLRASLDLVASELARANGKSDKNVYFPFADSSDALDERIQRQNFDRAGPEAVATLKRFAPYKGGNIPLRAMHDLDIDDKHKALILTTQEHGMRVVADVVDGVIRPESIRVSHNPESVKLVFPADGPFAGADVVPALEELAELATSIIDAFSAIFKDLENDGQ